jgi:hypothetical protein
MPIYPPTPIVRFRPAATMLPNIPPAPPPPPPQIANPPSAPSLRQGSGSDLTVTWNTPAIDGKHDVATGFNLRFGPAGAGTWTTVACVTSPYTLAALTDFTAYDVELQSTNIAGTSVWSVSSTLTTASSGPHAPNAPVITGVAPPPDGTTGRLAVTWIAPVIDGTHEAATSYNLRSSPAGAGLWTYVTGVSSPYTITGLAGATTIDVEVQATNLAPSPSAWSVIATGTTWGVTVATGDWAASAEQVHGTSVAPHGGVQMNVIAAPTPVTGAAFAWSQSNAAIPTTDLIAAAPDGQTDGWGMYINAPDVAGTFYLWMLAQGAGGTTSGALVTSAIVVA